MPDDLPLPGDQLDLLEEPAPWDEEVRSEEREQERAPKDEENGAGG